MKIWITALRLFLAMTVLTGVIYPLLVTGIAKTVWPTQAEGSLIKKGTEVIGSALIAQKFTKEAYFHPRPSAVGYDASSSGASNRGPTNADLKKNYDDGIAAGLSQEMSFASASGLDPHISPQAALDQVDRIAVARNFQPERKQDLVNLVNQAIEDRDLGFLGERRVNVLKLNLALDKIFGQNK